MSDSLTKLPGVEFYDKDDKALEAIGIHRELRREFSSWSTFSIAMSILGCASSVALTFNTPLLSGGPAAVVWSWFLGSWGCIALAVSVAELVSAYPSSGGAYAATGFVFGPRYRRGISFLNAWITFVGQLATPASVNFACSFMIYAAVTIANDGNFTPSTGQVLGLYCGLNVLGGIINVLPTRLLDRFTSSWVWINLATCFAIMIGVPAAASVNGTRASSSFVWTTVIDGTGWNNKPFAFLLGLLSVQWTMTDYDASAHLAEEIKNAAIVVPNAITIGVTCTAFIGFWLNVALCYGIRDMSVLPGPTTLVFAQILWDNFGKRGALAVWSFIIIIQIFTGLACQLTSIRSMYAISRDGALPDGKLLSRVWHVTKTPVNAAIFTVVIQCLFGLLYLGSYVAVNAVFSITAVALDLSFIIPTAGKLYLYLFPLPDVQFKPGPFYLGKWGYAINAYAVAWTLLETGILVMPQVYPVTSSNMNYAGPITGGVILFSAIWYHIYGKHLYSPSYYVRAIEAAVSKPSPMPGSRDSDKDDTEPKEKSWES